MSIPHFVVFVVSIVTTSNNSGVLVCIPMWMWANIESAKETNATTNQLHLHIHCINWVSIGLLTCEFWNILSWCFWNLIFEGIYLFIHYFFSQVCWYFLNVDQEQLNNTILIACATCIDTRLVLILITLHWMWLWKRVDNLPLKMWKPATFDIKILNFSIHCMPL